MSTSSDLSLRVLLALRLQSPAPADVVAAAAGRSEPETLALLETLRSSGWVRHREGLIPGWSLLGAGRAAGERMLADELVTSGGGTVVHDAYRQFLALNQPFLQVCTDWQLIEIGGARVVNDHADPTHDAAVIERLRALGERVAPVCRELGSALARFEQYRPRFAAAIDRIDAGEIDWFTKPTQDSFHTVWFELHENLLATLGIERGTEGTPMTTPHPLASQDVA